MALSQSALSGLLDAFVPVMAWIWSVSRSGW